jgi:hypothetical protein
MFVLRKVRRAIIDAARTISILRKATCGPDKGHDKEKYLFHRLLDFYPEVISQRRELIHPFFVCLAWGLGVVCERYLEIRVLRVMDIRRQVKFSQ